MSARARLFLAVLAGVVLIVATTATFAAVAVMRDGNIEVEVRGDGGQDFSMTVPASLVRALKFQKAAFSFLPSGWVWVGAAILVVSGLWIAQTEKT